MKVSVLLITYNHEPFLSQAVESVLAQQTDFEYEILIAEDCSTDNTRRIAKEFAARYPDRIRLSLSESNVGTNAVILRGLADARGEYVALLDGDDYWSSPEKLRLQARFLDDHPECSMCYHAADTLHPDGTVSPFPKPLRPAALTAKSILRQHLIATCSVMFRRSSAEPLPPWYGNCVFDDWPLYFVLAERGRVGYLDECLGVYREHGGGAWSGLSRQAKLENSVRFYSQMTQWVGERYRSTLAEGLAQAYYSFAASKQQADRAAAERYARLALAANPWHVRAQLLLRLPKVHDVVAALRQRLRR